MPLLNGDSSGDYARYPQPEGIVDFSQVGDVKLSRSQGWVFFLSGVFWETAGFFFWATAGFFF
ncbi:MAG: hypothetical protein AB7F09_09590 [Parvibaculaceae bacterium]